MTNELASLVSSLLKGSIPFFVVNEVRGLILAGPLLVAMYQAGGSLMAIWLAVCSLAGIALSVGGPVWLARALPRVVRRQEDPLGSACR